jgi:hypothetical protein
MNRLLILVAAAALMLGAGVACNGDDDDDGGEDSASPTAASAAESPTARATNASGTPTAASGGSTPAASDGRTYSEEDARAILEAVSFKPADFDGAWTVTNDNTATNADAAQNDPESAEASERCGRLLGRTVVLQPEDVVAAFIGGQTLSFFSNLTVYASDAGAIDCSAAAAQRFAQPGELARAFGSVFINPDTVVVEPFDFPQVADGSFASTLTGQIDAAGTIVDLTILLVAFRRGNVTAAVGSAQSGATPPADELRPYVDQTIDRIDEARE